MTNSKRLAIASILGLIAMPMLALPQSAKKTREQNRENLAKLRKDPERYGPLLLQARAFLDLPREQQQKLRALDREIHKLSVSQQKELLEVMKRYALWLASLTDRERRQIERATDRDAKLHVIKKIREQQWVASLPKADRERLAKLKGKKRNALLAELRTEEKRWQAQWQLAFNHWQELIRNRNKPLPVRFEDFKNPRDKRDTVSVYANEYLRRRLSDEEWQRLQDAQGKWPLFPCTLVELADRHPLALPGKRGPTSLNDMPKRVQTIFRKAAGANQALRRLKAEGKWPEFGTAVAKVMSEQKLRYKKGRQWTFEFLPTCYEDLTVAVRGFVTDTLEPLLTADEKFQLEMASGEWPAYPNKIQQLADNYGLRVPWQTLPGPQNRWEAYRVRNYELIEDW